MQDLAFKAELRDELLAIAALDAAGAALVATARQRDTYFRVPIGVLKRREAVVDGHPEPVEYIRYERDRRTGPRITRFHIYDEAEAAERFGINPLPEWITVEKTRRVYMLGNVRVHIDEVDRLGRFLEIESLVTRRHNLARAHAAVSDLRTRLGPSLGEPLAASYADLLAAEPDHR